MNKLLKEISYGKITFQFTFFRGQNNTCLYSIGIILLSRKKNAIITTFLNKNKSTKNIHFLLAALSET